MTSSGSAIADQLVSIFSASTLFGSYVSKNSYAIMESSNDVAMKISFTGYSGAFTVFGDGEPLDNWRFRLETYVRDTGVPETVLNTIWSINDKVVAAIKANPTINNTVDQIIRLDAEHNPQTGITFSGGATWIPIMYTLEVENSI